MSIENDEWMNLRSVLEQSDSISAIRKTYIWVALDKPLPPPSAYKQELIKRFAEEYQLETFVETGTYLGQMVEATQGFFESIHSIELSDELYSNARAKF